MLLVIFITTVTYAFSSDDYLFEGFLAVQLAVDNAYIRVAQGSSKPSSYNVSIWKYLLTFLNTFCNLYLKNNSMFLLFLSCTWVLQLQVHKSNGYKYLRTRANSVSIPGISISVDIVVAKITGYAPTK